jgi:glutamine amidotransferase
MCQLLGICSPTPIQINKWVKTFIAASDRNPHGWGFADLSGGGALIEKEALRASNSDRLRGLLSKPVVVSDAFFHIRRATIGDVTDSNCHPFTALDALGRRWTLSHHGSIFSFAASGGHDKRTDSERVLEYIIGRVNAVRAVSPPERFAVLEKALADLSAGNKLNALIHDSEFFYAYMNYHDSLYTRNLGGATIFSTEPLDGGVWEIMPLAVLRSYRAGKRVREGGITGCAYDDDDQDTRWLYQQYSQL